MLWEKVKESCLVVGTERDQRWEKLGGKGRRLRPVEHVVERVGMGLCEEGGVAVTPYVFGHGIPVEVERMGGLAGVI